MPFRPQPSSSDAFKDADPLTDNCSYNGAIDLFSWHPMLSDSFSLDLPDDLVGFEPKDLPRDMFASPSDINGFAVANHLAEDVSESISDPESDDQWSPTGRLAAFDSLLDLSPKPTETETHLHDREQRRYSSSPEITPRDSQQSSSSSPTRSSRRRLSSDPPVRNAAKRAAHNVIEKRYRTNMNAKFEALEKSMSGGNCVQNSSKSGGSASLKKSEILSNAIAYMHELQEQNRYLQKELAVTGQGLVVGGTWRHPSKREMSYR